MGIPELEGITPYLERVLMASHQRFEKGWPGISFEEYIMLLINDRHYKVIKEIEQRCWGTKVWSYIDCIYGPWTYEAGKDISQGFDFICKNPDELLNLLRNSKLFCEDSPTWSQHGARDCFRELIKAGPGLHICIAQKGVRENTSHNIHIDKYQMVCDREEDGGCNYEFFSSEDAISNAWGHYRDVIPWWLKKNIK